MTPVKKIPCPRCARSTRPGAAPAPHEHGFRVVHVPEALGGTTRPSAEVARVLAACTLCSGRKYLTAADVAAINRGSRLR